MNLWQSLVGFMEVELISAEMHVALRTINEHGIALDHLLILDDLTCRFCISRKNYRELNRLSKKRGETLRICRKKGIFWLGKTMLRRPVFWCGLLIILLLTLYLPTRILFIRVEGNDTVPDRKIMEVAEVYGVFFGASRREIRSERVKNGLLSDISQLQWAGVNTTGCTAIISVRERAPQEKEEVQLQVSRIVAERDGYIISGTAIRGNALFQTGQTIRQGQVLISGYTDCGFCIRAVRAEGEIRALTNRDFKAVLNGQFRVRNCCKGVKRKISLLFRKKRINLWKDSGISDATCGRMYEEYYITLPGGFSLPVALCVEEYTVWDTSSEIMSEKEARTQLEAFARSSVQKQMVAGTIRNCAERFTSDNGMLMLQGSYVCEEMIGREQPEQIGETNGKDH